MLGGTVDELQGRMTSAEFTDWLAFYAVEPWGEVRSDLQNATLLALLANANRDAKKHPAAFRVDQFMPDYWQPMPTAQRTVNLLEKFKVLTAATHE